MSSAAAAETGGIYGNAQEAITCRISLRALGHPQATNQNRQLYLQQFCTCKYQATPIQNMGHAMELAA
jgi:hypothetical protein